MSVQITSTTDTPEAVLAATGSLAADKSKSEEKSASEQPAEKSDETSEELESSDEISDENEDDESSEADETDEDEQKEKKPKKNGGYQKKINKLTGKLSAKDQEIEDLKAQLAKGSKPESEIKSEKVTSVSDQKPNPDNYDTHAEYVEAVADYKLDQREKERVSKEKEDQVKTEYQKSTQAFQSKVIEFKQVAKDFDEVLEDIDDIPMSISLKDSILSSDNGPKILYELAKNRDEYMRINSLNYGAAAREFGKLEAAYAKSEKNAEKKTTKAPPPIDPIGSKGSVKSAKNPDDMSYQEYKAYRAQPNK